MSGVVEAPYPADVTDAPASPELGELPTEYVPEEAGAMPAIDPVDAVSNGRCDSPGSDQVSCPMPVAVVARYGLEPSKSCRNPPLCRG